MATIEERLAALEGIVLGKSTEAMLTIATNSTAPSTEKRLELLESTVRAMMDHDEKVIGLVMKSNEQVIKLVEEFIPVKLQVAIHEARFSGLHDAAKKALDEKKALEEGPFRKG